MQVPNANIRSPSYYIAEMQARCAKCGRQARVLALAVPPNHEILVDGEWQNLDGDAFIFYAAELPEGRGFGPPTARGSDSGRGPREGLRSPPPAKMSCIRKFSCRIGLRRTTWRGRGGAPP